MTLRGEKKVSVIWVTLRGEEKVSVMGGAAWGVKGGGHPSLRHVTTTPPERGCRVPSRSRVPQAGPRSRVPKQGPEAGPEAESRSRVPKQSPEAESRRNVEGERRRNVEGKRRRSVEGERRRNVEGTSKGRRRSAEGTSKERRRNVEGASKGRRASARCGASSEHTGEVASDVRVPTFSAATSVRRPDILHRGCLSVWWCHVAAVRWHDASPRRRATAARGRVRWWCHGVTWW